MEQEEQTRYIVYDTESVVDGELLGRVLYREEGLTGEAAIERYLEQKDGVQEALPLVVGTEGGAQTQAAVSAPPA